ncbi:MAG: T9SS type A sorting domain-containing protein [Bacteroidota bacterium]
MKKIFSIILFLFTILTSKASIIINGPYTLKSCANDLVCFTDMEIINTNQNDSTFIWIDKIDSFDATFTKKWNKNTETWTLCWQSRSTDGRLTPYIFKIFASNKLDTVYKNFEITILPNPKSSRTFSFIGNDTFLFELKDTSVFANSSSDCRWKIPYPNGNLVYGCNFDFYNQGLAEIIVQSTINSNIICTTTAIDTINLRFLKINEEDKKTNIEVYYEENNVVVASHYNFPLSIILYDINGQIKIPSTILFPNSKFILNIKSIKAGIYLLRTQHGNYSKKIIVK